MVWGCSSAGEHFVDIEGVTGSIPVTPTIFFLNSIYGCSHDMAAVPSVTCCHRRIFMASIRNRNGRYQAQVRINGHSTSSSFDTRSEARAWAAGIEASLLSVTGHAQQLIGVSFELFV